MFEIKFFKINLYLTIILMPVTLQAQTIQQRVGMLQSQENERCAEFPDVKCHDFFAKQIALTLSQEDSNKNNNKANMQKNLHISNGKEIYSVVSSTDGDYFVKEVEKEIRNGYHLRSPITTVPDKEGTRYTVDLIF